MLFLVLAWLGCGALSVVLVTLYGDRKAIRTFDDVGNFLSAVGLGPISLYKVLTEDLKGKELPWN